MNEAEKEERPKELMESSLISKRLKLGGIIYIAWLLLTTLFLILFPNKYVFSFSDLPVQMMGIPTLIVSFFYLAVFLPAVIAAVTCSFYLFISSLLNYFKRNKN